MSWISGKKLAAFLITTSLIIKISNQQLYFNDFVKGNSWENQLIQSGPQSTYKPELRCLFVLTKQLEPYVDTIRNLTLAFHDIFPMEIGPPLPDESPFFLLQVEMYLVKHAYIKTVQVYQYIQDTVLAEKIGWQENITLAMAQVTALRLENQRLRSQLKLLKPASV